MEVVVHLGAHRTASTTLQIMLAVAGCVSHAADLGVLCPPRPGWRPSRSIRGFVEELRRVPRWRQRLPGHRRRTTRKLLELCPNADQPPRRLVVSEENLLGKIVSEKLPGLYPEAGLNAARLFERTHLTPSKLFLTVRSYETFLPSAFAMESCFADRPAPQSAFRAVASDPGNGWLGVIRRLSQRFPGVPLVVWPHETTPLPERLTGLLGQPFALCDALSATIAVCHPSPTREAIAAVAQLRAASPQPALAKAEIDTVIRQHADGTRPDPREWFDEAHQNRLRTTYQDHLEAIRDFLANHPAQAHG